MIACLLAHMQVDPGESPEAALARELAEELHIQVGDLFSKCPFSNFPISKSAACTGGSTGSSKNT